MPRLAEAVVGGRELLPFAVQFSSRDGVHFSPSKKDLSCLMTTAPNLRASGFMSNTELNDFFFEDEDECESRDAAGDISRQMLREVSPDKTTDLGFLLPGELSSPQSQTEAEQSGAPTSNLQRIIEWTRETSSNLNLRCCECIFFLYILKADNGLNSG